MPRVLTALVIIGGSLILGWLVERLALSRFLKVAARTKWKIDDLLARTLKGTVLSLFFLLGLRAALPYLPLSAGVLAAVAKIILAAILMVVTLMAMRFFSGVASLYASAILPATTSIFRNIVNVVVLIFGLLIISQTLGINITPMITALGVGGLAVALALQDTLSNLFAGLHIIAVKQISPNDYIKLDSGEEGYVVDVGWRNTTIRMLPNNMVIVPNTKIASSTITNYSLPQKELSVLVQVGVSYDSDLEHVERVTVEVAKEVLARVPGGVTEFEPFIRYHTFGDSSIDFSVILRGKEFVDQYMLKHEFVKALHKRYQEEGIEIPFPIRTIVMKRGEE